MAARPAPTEPIPERIVVIGCAGSGKTTLARALAGRLGALHLERDALGDDEAPSFATQVAAAIDATGSRWVFDGALQRRAGGLSTGRHRGRPGLSPAGRAAARPGPLASALVDPPRRWGTHLRLPSVALVGRLTTRSVGPPGRTLLGTPEIAALFARPELGHAHRLRFTSPRQAASWLVSLNR